MMTFEDIIRVEPRLRDVLNLAIASRDRDREVSRLRWYNDVKPHVVKLVGWFRESEGSAYLFSSHAYETVYYHLFDVTMSDVD